MDTDKQRALADALALLAQSGPPVPTTDTQPCERILTDVDALLVLVDNQATKLALALKPPNPAYEPAEAVIVDLAQHTSKLVYAAHLVRDDVHGAMLARHVKRHVGQIIEALRDLAQSFITDGDEGYLVKAGALHDLIETARGPSGIPKDNQAAVLLSWKSDKDALEDNLKEISQIIQDAESHTTVDDGWDEIGLTRTANLDQLELLRANKAHQVLRLTTLLHKRIQLDILSYPSSAPLSALDTLALFSNDLLVASDDLVAALYSPQDPELICEETLQISDVAFRTRTLLRAAFFPDTDQLTQQLHAASLESTTSASTSRKKADKKWFETCVDQIDAVSSKLVELTEETPAK